MPYANSNFVYMQMNILREEDSDLATTDNNSVVIGSEVKALLKKVPKRAVTDVLIQHFLSEANWIYEMVYPTTFLERYNEWWSHPCQSVDDLEFAALLLRLCSYSAQFLPSQNYTADSILGTSLSTIREPCDATAIALSRSPINERRAPATTSDSSAFLPSLPFEERGRDERQLGHIERSNTGSIRDGLTSGSPEGPGEDHERSRPRNGEENILEFVGLGQVRFPSAVPILLSLGSEKRCFSCSKDRA